MIALQMATLIQSILTSFGIIVGGVWVYFHYFRGRTYSPRLEAQINGRVIPKSDATFLIVTAQLSNLLKRHNTLEELVANTAWLATSLVDVLLKVAGGEEPYPAMASDLGRRIREAEIRLELLREMSCQ